MKTKADKHFTPLNGVMPGRHSAECYKDRETAQISKHILMANERIDILSTFIDLLTGIDERVEIAGKVEVINNLNAIEKALHDSSQESDSTLFVRFCVLDPESDLVKFTKNRLGNTDHSVNYQHRLLLGINKALQLQRKYFSNFSVRLIDALLPQNYILIDDTFVFIDANTSVKQLKDRITLKMDLSIPGVRLCYENYFSAMWKMSKEPDLLL